MLKNSLGDTAGATYSSDMRTIAMSNAVRGYSRYRGFTRRFGFGSVYADINTGGGATTLYFVGLGGVGMPGGISLPCQVTLSYGLPWSEVVTINSISRPAPADNLDSTAWVATLAGPGVTIKHYAGDMIWQASPGLNLVAGTDLYFMPLDFIAPDEETWGIAIGSRLWVKREESYYDGVVRMSERIGGVGWGQRQGFSGGPTFGQGFAGTTASASGLNVPQGGSGQVDFTFVEGSPTVLMIAPIPRSGQTLDFRYVAQALPQDIPDKDMDALLFLAKADCYDQRIAVLGQQLGDSKEADISETYSTQIRALVAAAEQARSRFDDYVRNQPILVSG